MNIHKLAATIPDLLQSGNSKNKGSYNPKQMAMGKQIEHEHTKGLKLDKSMQDTIAKKISKDHLAENKGSSQAYYTELKKLESKLKKQSASEGKDELTKDQENKIIEFVTNSENLDDTTFHAFCDILGVSPHEAEEVVYARISKPKDK